MKSIIFAALAWIMAAQSFNSGSDLDVELDDETVQVPDLIEEATTDTK